MTKTIRRLRLNELMATTRDENDQLVSANWVAKKTHSTHNTIMYYKEHYQKDLLSKGKIRQPSFMLVKELCDLFNTSVDELIEWEDSSGVAGVAAIAGKTGRQTVPAHAATHR